MVRDMDCLCVVAMCDERDELIAKVADLEARALAARRLLDGVEHNAMPEKIR